MVFMLKAADGRVFYTADLSHEAMQAFWQKINQSFTDEVRQRFQAGQVWNEVERVFMTPLEFRDLRAEQLAENL